MPAYRFVTVDVFTDQRFGGNPLAVFPDARGLSDAEMQSLAAEFNLSETTFVFPPENPGHTARVRIFHRTAEMPFAGHPMVGTGYVLAREGRGGDGTLLFEVPAGVVRVDIEHDDAGEVTGSLISAPQPLSTGMEFPVETIARCAGLEIDDIVLTTHRPIHASVGTWYVIAEVTSDALERAAPSLEAFHKVCVERTELNGRFSLHLYAHRRVEGESTHLRARMFSPEAGTIEDAATGSANTALAALLLSHSNEDARRFEIMQGVEMGRPSLLHATATRAADGIRATVAGHCVPMLRGEALL